MKQKQLLETKKVYQKQTELNGLGKQSSQCTYSRLLDSSSSPCGLGINPLPKQALVFVTHLQYKSFKNTAGKGEIARNEQFLLFPQYFLPFEEVSAIFIRFEIVICKSFRS